MLVLVDFGLCRRFCSTAMCTGESVRCMTGVTGTYGYMAPEVFRKEQYDAKIDVYSGSMVVSFMLLGGTPFPRIPGFQVSQLMERQNLRPNLFSCKHRELVRLLTRAWDVKPNLRPHAHEMEAQLQILHHAFIRAKENSLSSKMSSALSSASDSFRRVSTWHLSRTSTTATILRASSTATAGSTSAETVNSQSSTCDDQGVELGPLMIADIAGGASLERKGVARSSSFTRALAKRYSTESNASVSTEDSRATTVAQRLKKAFTRKSVSIPRSTSC